MDELVGRKLGKYEIESVLGAGGMASVFRARDTMLGRIVAIKVLDPTLAEDHIAVERFNREAVTAAKLQHPSIVAIYDVQQQDGYHYIAMRYIPGETLRDIINRDAPLNLSRTVEILRPVAAALDYAHMNGIVHRDIKPGNILVNAKNGETVLTDFGIARAQDQSHLTAVGMVMGTADYLSPEQVRGEEATASSDNYALGIVAYEMLTGQPPFFDKQVADVLKAHLNEPPPPLSRFNPSLPSTVQQVINRALAKRPTDRFASASAMVDALAAAMPASRTAAPPNPTVRTPQAQAQPQRTAYTPPLKQQPLPPPARRLTPTPPQRQTRQSSNAGLWVAFLVLLLIIAGLIAYLVLSNKPANSIGNTGNAVTEPSPTVAEVTAAPTAAKSPTAYAGPLRPEANGDNMIASRDEPPPQIDGDIGEWTSRHPSPVTINSQANVITGLPRKWGGPADLSGTCYMAWDDANFYFAARVVDNAHVQNSTGGELYKGDHIELWFDTNLPADFDDTKISSDDWQIGLSPGNFGSIAPEAYIWSNRDAALRQQIKVAAKPDGNGYTLEAAIPWRILNNINPALGLPLGFEIDLSDTDDTTPGALAQELMLSSSPARAFNNPTSWGNIFLK